MRLDHLGASHSFRDLLIHPSMITLALTDSKASMIKMYLYKFIKDVTYVYRIHIIFVYFYIYARPLRLAVVLTLCIG